MSGPSLPPWTGGTGSVILKTNTTTTQNLEPSGLTFVANSGHFWLYLASDDGEVACLSSQNGSSWEVQTIGSGKDYDFEAITTVNGTTSVLIGVEGAKEKTAPFTNPSLIEYTITNTSITNFLSPSGSSWSLGGMPLASNSGMEACTYVPYSACPQTWTAPTGHDGYFFAATQQAPGSIFIYDLPAANGGQQTVSTYQYRLDPPLVQAYKISDMFYSSNQNILYVLFDEETTSNNTTTYFSVLQGLRANSEQFLSQGYMQAPYCGCEGVAEYNDALYLGLDQNGAQKAQNGLSYNYVYKYVNFSI